MTQKSVLKVFNSIVIPNTEVIGNICFDNLKYGIITDFVPDRVNSSILKTLFKPLNVETLFTKEERLNSDVISLITKQILHYIEVYGLNNPGFFDLTVKEGVIIKPCFVKGITFDELVDLMNDVLYTNKPIKYLNEIVDIIRSFEIPYKLNDIKNNELRIRLFNPLQDKFSNGDDVIRYMVWVSTGETLVIKNKKIYSAIKDFYFEPKFFENNAVALSEVFNRFKPIILSAKNSKTKSIINKISRMSKYNHKPVYIGINKIFVSEMIKLVSSGSSVEKIYKMLDKLTSRDKFKILNYLEYKSYGYDVDVFNIRNGSMFIKKDRKNIPINTIAFIESVIINSLKDDYKDLKNKTILLDDNVDYGLPISEKQTLGNLPFGTTVTVNGDISSGIYWENSWGASDLDLSTIDKDGNRVGWGRTFDDKSILFSGDITDAQNGAMEFMTSKDRDYGLFVNIYSGYEDSEFELVVGTSNKEKWTSNKEKWIDDCIIREKSSLTGNGSIIGFVKGNVFTVYQGKLSNRRQNFEYKGNPSLNKVNINYWTVKKIFDKVGVKYDTIQDSKKKYDIDLTYSKFSLDKLNFLLYK